MNKNIVSSQSMELTFKAVIEYLKLVSRYIYKYKIDGGVLDNVLPYKYIYNFNLFRANTSFGIDLNLKTSSMILVSLLR